MIPQPTCSDWHRLTQTSCTCHGRNRAQGWEMTRCTAKGSSALATPAMAASFFLALPLFAVELNSAQPSLQTALTRTCLLVPAAPFALLIFLGNPRASLWVIHHLLPLPTCSCFANALLCPLCLLLHSSIGFVLVCL